MASASRQRCAVAKCINHIYTIIALCVLVANAVEARQRGGGSRRHEKTEVNLCSKDNDMKLGCHCSHDDAKRTVIEADCFVLHEDFPQSDAAWLSFRQHPNLRHFTLTVHKNGYMSYLPSDVLKYQRELRSITITYADIREIPMFAFGNLSRLENITLVRSQVEVLHAYAFANHDSLAMLNLEDNQIGEMDPLSFSNLPELLDLELSRNNITQLHEGMFAGLGKLMRLKAADNQIHDLTKAVFKGLGNLRELDVSFNAIRVLRDTVFAELWSMQDLNLESNAIERLSDRAFDGLNNLRSLNLRSNKLQILQSGVFTGVLALTTLNLNGNALETLTYSNVMPLMDSLVNNTHSSISLADNNFICDCRLAWMFDLRAQTKNIDIKRTIEKISCSMNRAHTFSHDLQGVPNYNHLPFRIEHPYPIVEYDELGNELADRNHQQQVKIHRTEPSIHELNSQLVLLMNVGAENLPCRPVQDIEPTELPLPRESIGLDLSWLSSSNRAPCLPHRPITLFAIACAIVTTLFSMRVCS